MEICMCVYFEADRTNIPHETIALLAEPRQLSNNLYAYTDIASGKTVLSVTTLKYAGKPDQEVIGTIEKEIKRFAGGSGPPSSTIIPQALPDRTDLRDQCTEDLLARQGGARRRPFAQRILERGHGIGVSCGLSPAAAAQSALIPSTSVHRLFG